jgi:hypothetical protein
MLRPSFCACSYCVSTTRNIAQRRAANRGLWGLSPGELCQQTDRGNGTGRRMLRLRGGIPTSVSIAQCRERRRSG